MQKSLKFKQKYHCSYAKSFKYYQEKVQNPIISNSNGMNLELQRNNDVYIFDLITMNDAFSGDPVIWNVGTQR